MDKLKQFYTNRCEPHTNQNLVFLRTDYEKVVIDTTDSIYSEYRYLELGNLVRFLNPKVNFIKQTLPEIDDDFTEMDDFDEVENLVSEMEVPSSDIVQNTLEVMRPLYFLPSHIETKIKGITCGNQRSKIDNRLKSIIPTEYVDELGLKFKPEDSKEFVIDYDSRSLHSISFFKFFRDNECEECSDFSEIEKKVNEVKHKLNVTFVESMDYYFIGDIRFEYGLIERNENEHNRDPLYYHFNFWKLWDEDFKVIFNDFCLYPFLKEAQ